MTPETLAAAQDFIKQFEGCKLTQYNDSAGLGTIGVGHKITPEDDFPEVITQAEADAIFAQDLINSEKQLMAFVKVPLTNNQTIALLDFIFNEGIGHFASSTLCAKINDKDYNGAAQEFGRWIYAGGTALAGLVRRRAAEKVLFLKPDNI